MVIDTHKSGHTMFYKSQIRGAEYSKSGFHGHLEAVSHLPVTTKADFIIGDTSKGSFRVLETKKRAEPVSIGGKTWYATMPTVSRDLSVETRLEKIEEQFDSLVRSTWSYVFSDRDVEEMRELSTAMLEESVTMQELAEKFREAADEQEIS